MCEGIILQGGVKPNLYFLSTVMWKKQNTSFGLIWFSVIFICPKNNVVFVLSKLQSGLQVSLTVHSHQMWSKFFTWQDKIKTLIHANMCWWCLVSNKNLHYSHICTISKYSTLETRKIFFYSVSIVLYIPSHIQYKPSNSIYVLISFGFMFTHPIPHM